MSEEITNTAVFVWALATKWYAAAVAAKQSALVPVPCCNSPSKHEIPRRSSVYFQSGLMEVGWIQKYSPPERRREKEREKAHLQIPAHAALNASASLHRCKRASRICNLVDARRSLCGRLDGVIKYYQPEQTDISVYNVAPPHDSLTKFTNVPLLSWIWLWSGFDSCSLTAFFRWIFQMKLYSDQNKFVCVHLRFHHQLSKWQQLSSWNTLVSTGF